MPVAQSLSSVFLDAAAAHPDRPALAIGEHTVSYAELRRSAASIAATLFAHRGDQGPPLTAVLGQRTESGFAGILGALMSGHGYVPMLPSFPPGRVALMIERSQTRALLVDVGGMKILPQVLAAVPQPLLVVLLDAETTDIDDELRAAAGPHRLLGRSDLVDAAAWQPPTVAPDDIAYLLFTSGSTGQPKGVMVAHRNIARFLDVVIERYGLGPEDRFSHMFDVTFDLSLFDLFGAWAVGGCLCCPTIAERLLPANYVVDSKLTVWFSVPSTALLMKEMQTLSPGTFESLRWSLFCGEALPVPVADAWAAAADRSVVENLYGPTELTLACTLFRWDEAGRAATTGDVVPIGEPFPGMRYRVVDDALAEVAPGQTGELTMTGPQRALGYWNDPERTGQSFVVLPGQDELYYRTGDLVRRPSREGEPITFLGRIDSQIKLRGYRVELGEIEAALREAGQLDVAVVLGWPLAASGGAQGVVAFINDASVDTNALLDTVAERLPKYMVPRRIEVVERFPLNDNGKIDRKALRATLDAAAP